MVNSKDKHLKLWLENSSNSVSVCFSVCPLRRPYNDTLAGQIAGLPLVWNCKHSGEGSLGHSREILNWEFLEELFVCLHSCSGTAVLTASPVITALSQVRILLVEMKASGCSAFLCKMWTGQWWRWYCQSFQYSRCFSILFIIPNFISAFYRVWRTLIQ